MTYPSLNVYCEKIANTLKEKFRSFSGSVQMTIEVRHSQDRLDGLQDALELYVDSVTQVLDAERGDWGSGMFYAGGYEVTLATDRCHVLQDPWGDQALPLRFDHPDEAAEAVGSLPGFDGIVALGDRPAHLERGHDAAVWRAQGFLRRRRLAAR